MTAPLDGLRVIDLTHVLAGPFATMRLGDMGADVVKLEPPRTGEPTRAWGPPFENGFSAYFFSLNRNKRGLTCDLKTDAGRDVARRLIARADVLIENFRPGAFDRLNLGPFPERLILCSISGYGRNVDRPAFDNIVQGECGLQDLTGDPDGPPMKAGFPMADLVAGLTAVESILLALLHRAKTGRGQRIDIALHDALLALSVYQSQIYFFTGQRPARLGNAHPSLVPYNTCATADGWLSLGVATDEQFGALCSVLGVENLWKTNPDRARDRDAVERLVADRLATRPTAHWVAALSARGVPCGPIRNLADALENSPDMVLPVGFSRMVGLPQKLSDSPGAVRLPPPRLGEHTDEILTELGYSNSEIASLRTSGAI